MTKEQFIAFATEIAARQTRISTAKEEIKNIKEDIKEAIEIFAAEHDKDEKIVKTAVKEYLNYLENQAEFTEFDLALSEIKDTVIYAAPAPTTEE